MQIVGILAYEPAEQGGRSCSAGGGSCDSAAHARCHFCSMAMDGTTMDVTVRTERPTVEVIPELRDILRRASPEFQNVTITTMDQIVEDSLWKPATGGAPAGDLRWIGVALVRRGIIRTVGVCCDPADA